MLIPWDKLVEAVKPCYPQAGKGRAPYPLENMWERVQLFYNLSDPATQDMLYEIESVRRFTGTCRNKVPDKRTILNFRHLLEHHGLGKMLFESIKEYLAEEGPKMTRAPCSASGAMPRVAQNTNRVGRSAMPWQQAWERWPLTKAQQ